MPKHVGRRIIEHWRDGECIGQIEVKEKMIERIADGTARVVFPPGQVTLATGDELHFDVDGLIESLQNAPYVLRPRVVIHEDLDLRKNDTLVFDFISENICDTEHSS